jgi:hypothetical protein
MVHRWLRSFCFTKYLRRKLRDSRIPLSRPLSMRSGLVITGGLAAGAVTLTHGHGFSSDASPPPKLPFRFQLASSSVHHPSSSEEHHDIFSAPLEESASAVGPFASAPAPDTRQAPQEEWTLPANVAPPVSSSTWIPSQYAFYAMVWQHVKARQVTLLVSLLENPSQHVAATGPIESALWATLDVRTACAIIFVLNTKSTVPPHGSPRCNALSHRVWYEIFHNRSGVHMFNH